MVLFFCPHFSDRDVERGGRIFCQKDGVRKIVAWARRGRGERLGERGKRKMGWRWGERLRGTSTIFAAAVGGETEGGGAEDRGVGGGLGDGAGGEV